MMYLIDVRRRNKELIDIARDARDKFDVRLVDFYRLAVINALAIQVTPIRRKQEHYATDMTTLIYLNEEIAGLMGDDFNQKKFRELCVMIGTAGAKIRRNLPSFDVDSIDVARLKVAPDLLRGLIYAREV